MVKLITLAAHGDAASWQPNLKAYFTMPLPFGDALPYGKWSSQPPISVAAKKHPGEGSRGVVRVWRTGQISTGLVA